MVDTKNAELMGHKEIWQNKEETIKATQQMCWNQLQLKKQGEITTTASQTPNSRNPPTQEKHRTRGLISIRREGII